MIIDEIVVVVVIIVRVAIMAVSVPVEAVITAQPCTLRTRANSLDPYFLAPMAPSVDQPSSHLAVTSPYSY